MIEQNDRCVYAHKDRNGNIFYIGSGTLKRANTKQLSKTKGRGTCRGSLYSNKVEELNFEYDVEIMYSGLNKESSLVLESEVIIKSIEAGHNIVNKRTATGHLNYAKEFLQKYFYIDESSPTGLRWVTEYGKYKHKFKRGDVAGGTVPRGDYFRVGLNRESYAVHRVIMALLGYDLSTMVVDHKDGNPTNNKLDNLRVVPQSENLKNLSKRDDNSSGHTGINYSEVSKNWKVNWYENGKRFVKCFTVSKYNSKQLALEAAITFRKQVMKDLGYLER